MLVTLTTGINGTSLLFLLYLFCYGTRGFLDHGLWLLLRDNVLILGLSQQSQQRALLIAMGSSDASGMSASPSGKTGLKRQQALHTSIVGTMLKDIKELRWMVDPGTWGQGRMVRGIR